MAKIVDLNIPVEYAGAFYNALTTFDNIIFETARSKVGFLGRLSLSNLNNLLATPEIRAYWKTLSAYQKNLWSYGSAAPNITAYQYFIKDFYYRRALGLDIFPIQKGRLSSNVGKIELTGSASHILLKQRHSTTYTEAVRVVGHQGAFTLQDVTETISSRIGVYISAESHLVDNGGTATFKFFIRYYDSDGITFVDSFLVPNPYSTPTQISYTYTFESLPFTPATFDFFIEISNASGFLLVDKLVLHNYIDGHSVEYARDADFEDMGSNFSGKLLAVTPFWEVVSADVGATFGSIYFDCNLIQDLISDQLPLLI